MLCQYCVRSFVRHQCWCAHEECCVEKLASRVSKRKTAVLRPALELAQDQLHSAASLSIGQRNVFRGQENKDLYFPKTIKFFPAPGDVFVVKEGWSCKGVTGVKGGPFKKSQRDFRLRLFNNNASRPQWNSDQVVVFVRDRGPRTCPLERFHLLQNATVKILLTSKGDALHDFLFHALLTKKRDYSQQNAILCLTYAAYH